MSWSNEFGRVWLAIVAYTWVGYPALLWALASAALLAFAFVAWMYLLDRRERNAFLPATGQLRAMFARAR